MESKEHNKEVSEEEIEYWGSKTI